MPTNEAKGQLINESSDSPRFLAFLENEQANPPTRKEAKKVWDEFIAMLNGFINHKEDQERFLFLLEQQTKPLATDRASLAAAFPADHAFNLFERVRELDQTWYRKYLGRIARWGSGAGIGALVKWLIDNFDPRWLGFCLAILIGYLALDDFYDGGSLGSAAVIGLLVAVLLSLAEDKPTRRKPIDGAFKRVGTRANVHNRLTSPGDSAT